MTISNAERGFFRKVIRLHPAYAAHLDGGGKKTSEMSGADCADYCQRHGLSIEAIRRAMVLNWSPEQTIINVAGGEAPEAETHDETPDLEKPDMKPEPKAQKAQKAAPEAAPVQKGGALAALDVLAQALQASMTPDEVKSLIRSEVASLGLQPIIHVIGADGEKRGEIDGLRHKSADTLLTAVSAGLNVWIAGPAGSGKTHAAEQVAGALGLSFAFHGAMTMAHELIGFRDGRGTYHETDFVRAYRDGGVILLDEVDAGSNEALLALNGALANGYMPTPDGMIKRHPDFRCIAAANTWGLGATADYVGRARLDAAFLDRFGAKIAWDYDEALERKLAGNPDWCARVQIARKKAMSAGLKVIISPRATIAGAKLIAAGMTEDDAAKLTYLAGLTPAQIDMVEGK